MSWPEPKILATLCETLANGRRSGCLIIVDDQVGHFARIALSFIQDRWASVLLNCDPQGVMRCWVSYHVDVVIARLANCSSPALTLVGLSPDLDSSMPVKVRQITPEEPSMIVTQLFVMLVSP